MKKALRMRLKLLASALPFTLGAGVANAAVDDGMQERAGETVAELTRMVIENPESTEARDALMKIGLSNRPLANTRISPSVNLASAAMRRGDDSRMTSYPTLWNI